MGTSDSQAPTDEPTGTRLALIHAAGELFAERGLKGTSTRAIARRARSNIGCIHYHFGGKEKLYWAAVEYVFHRRITEQHVGLVPRARPSRQDIANVLAELVRRRLRAACGPEVPAWHSRLLWRNVTDGQLAQRPELVDRVFRPDYERFGAIVRKARPDMSERRTRLLFYQLVGQLIFYPQHKAKVFRELQLTAYDDEHLAEIALHIALSLTRMLKLPDPKAPSGGTK